MRLGLVLALSAAALAQNNRRDVFDETVAIPRNQWRAIRVSITERPSTLRCRFQVEQGDSAIRALVVTAGDVERFRDGQSFRRLAQTEAGRDGSLDLRIARPGDYRLLIDNRTSGGGAVSLKLKAWLDVHDGESFEARELPAETRRIVLGLSLVWLVVAGGWPGWKIWRAWRRRREALRGFHSGGF